MKTRLSWATLFIFPRQKNIVNLPLDLLHNNTRVTIEKQILRRKRKDVKTDFNIVDNDW